MRQIVGKHDNEIKIILDPVLPMEGLIALLRDLSSGGMFGSQKKLAEFIGISPQNLSDVIHGRRPVMHQILQCFGIREVLTYQPVGSNLIVLDIERGEARDGRAKDL